MNNETPIFRKGNNVFNSFPRLLFHNSSTTLNYKHFLLTGALINFAWVPLMNNTAAFPSKLLFQSLDSRKGKFCLNLQSWLQTEQLSLMSVKLKQALSSVWERNGLQLTFNRVAEVLEPVHSTQGSAQAHLPVPRGCSWRRNLRMLVLDTELPICQDFWPSQGTAAQLFPKHTRALRWIHPTNPTGWNKKKKNLKSVLTTKGLQIPRETVPGGTDFSTSTASAKVAPSRCFSLTNTKRSPGKICPPRSATPPATRELITMAVPAGSRGSWGQNNKKQPQVKALKGDVRLGCVRSTQARSCSGATGLKQLRRSESQHCQGLGCAKRKIFHHLPNPLRNVKIWKVTDTLPALSLHTQTQPGQAANRTTLAAFHQPPSSLGCANVTENNHSARHPRASEQQKWWQKEPLRRQKFNSKEEAHMEAPNVEERALMWDVWLQRFCSVDSTFQLRSDIFSTLTGNRRQLQKSNQDYYWRQGTL